MLLLACATSGPVTSDFCAVARPIYISRDDQFTCPTARQILDHNETGKTLCGWK